MLSALRTVQQSSQVLSCIFRPFLQGGRQDPQLLEGYGAGRWNLEELFGALNTLKAVASGSKKSSSYVPNHALQTGQSAVRRGDTRISSRREKDYGKDSAPWANIIYSAQFVFDLM